MTRTRYWLALALTGASVGCHGHLTNLFYVPPTPPTPLGVEMDPLFEAQEHNAEAAKYVMYQHEFELPEFLNGRNVNGYRLTPFGEDHIKRIAENLRRGATFPVVVERSDVSVDPNTQFRYPVHFNPELDMKRRLVVVRALQQLGIADADQRVVVAPAVAQSFTDSEAESAYRSGIGRTGWGGWGGWNGFGGWGWGFR